jgi:LppX_LprAFG lipoprotein
MRRVALLSLVLAATLALAACGGGKKTTSTAAPPQSPPVSAAAYRTSVARTSKTSVHVVFSGSLQTTGQKVAISGSGDVDSAARTGTMDVSITVGGQKLPLSEVLDGQTVYVGSSLLSSFLPSGKKWLKVPVSSAAKTFGPSSFALTSPGTVPGLEGVRRVGTATIDGVQTVEYSGRLDLSKLPQPARAALDSGSVTFRPVHVWVGSDGYVHRAKIDLSSQAGGTSSVLDFTTTLSKFGEKVSVTVPPASETVDAGKLQIPGLGGMGL